MVASRLAATGFVVGPLVDGIHNQVLLSYDIFPVTVGALKTSVLVPPLLAVAYPVLGLLPKLLGGGEKSSKSPIFAVASTAAVVQLSALVAGDPRGLLLVALAALVQWAVLDGTSTSFVVALAAGLLGPLCELPFLAAGAWHYIHPDYFVGDFGLNSVTGPCYFAVTTDAITLANFFARPPK